MAWDCNGRREGNSFPAVRLDWWQGCGNVPSPGSCAAREQAVRDVTEFLSVKVFKTQRGEASGG